MCVPQDHMPGPDAQRQAQMHALTYKVLAFLGEGTAVMADTIQQWCRTHGDDPSFDNPVDDPVRWQGDGPSGTRPPRVPPMPAGTSMFAFATSLCALLVNFRPDPNKERLFRHDRAAPWLDLGDT